MLRSSAPPDAYAQGLRHAGPEGVAGLARELDAEAVPLDAPRSRELVGQRPPSGLVGPRRPECLPSAGEQDLELDELATGRDGRTPDLAAEHDPLAVKHAAAVDAQGADGR